MSNFLSRLATAEQNVNTASTQDIDANFKTREIAFYKAINVGTYKPSKTAMLFHRDESDIKVIMGPYGSGKTSMCCMDVIFRACQMPPCLDGVRRARTIILRNTFDQLKKGIFDVWCSWCDNLGHVRKTSGNQLLAKHLFNDGYGLVELELWFIPLDSIDDIEKLKSFNATNAILNELSELPRSVLEHLPARLGRYPKKDTIDPQYITKKYDTEIILPNGKTEILECPYWHGIIADTNPPPIKHFIYTIFEKERPPNYKLFKQPPGLLVGDDGNVIKENGQYYPNVECDNYGIGLPKDYYIKQAQGATQEFIKVYCLGQYGTLCEGLPMYPQYNDDLHAVEDIQYVKDEPILITLDGGFTPAGLVQQCINGQLRAIKEFTTDRMYFDELIKNVLLPYATTTLENFEITWVCDPTITEREVLAVAELGIILVKALTNNIEPRVQAMTAFLNKMVFGEPAFLLSKVGCPVLREGFNGEYKFKKSQKITDEVEKDKPDKTHPISDVHDCAQYGALHFGGNMLKKSEVDTAQFTEAHLSSEWT